MLAEAKGPPKAVGRDQPEKEESPAELRARLKAEMKAQMLAEARTTKSAEDEACAAPLASGREDILTTNDPNEVLKLMREFPADLELQTKGCAAVLALADGGPRKLNAPFNAYSARQLNDDIITALVSAMAKFPKATALQTHAINALWVLARSEDNLTLIGAESEDDAEDGTPVTPIELTVAAMNTHIESGPVITHGCTLWTNLAHRNQEAADAVILADGIEAAVAGMGKHNGVEGDGAFAIAQCCMGLRNIASGKVSAELNPPMEVANAGAVRAVFDAFKAHPDSAAIHMHGIGLLINIVNSLQTFNTELTWEVLDMVAKIPDVEDILADIELRFSKETADRWGNKADISNRVNRLSGALKKCVDLQKCEIKGEPEIKGEVRGGWAF